MGNIRICLAVFGGNGSQRGYLVTSVGNYGNYAMCPWMSDVVERLTSR